MGLCTRNVHATQKWWGICICSVLSCLAGFQKWRLTDTWPSVIIVLFNCFLLCSIILFLPSSSSSLRHTHTSAEQMKRAMLAQRWGELLASACLNSWASCWEPGGSAVDRLPRGPGWGACLTSPWPYSVSPPAWCRLAPTWGAQGGPSRLHLFNCSSSIPHQSTTQQGKWREGKLKFNNRWEKERKRETQGFSLPASQQCATKQHFQIEKNVLIIASASIGLAIESTFLYLNDLEPVWLTWEMKAAIVHCSAYTVVNLSLYFPKVNISYCNILNLL